MLISSLHRPPTPTEAVDPSSSQADGSQADVVSHVRWDTEDFPWNRIDALPDPESPLPPLDPLDDDEYDGAPPLTQPCPIDWGLCGLDASGSWRTGMSSSTVIVIRTNFVRRPYSSKG